MKHKTPIETHVNATVEVNSNPSISIYKQNRKRKIKKTNTVKAAAVRKKYYKKNMKGCSRW